MTTAGQTPGAALAMCRGVPIISVPDARRRLSAVGEDDVGKDFLRLTEGRTRMSKEVFASRFLGAVLPLIPSELSNAMFRAFNARGEQELTLDDFVSGLAVLRCGTAEERLQFVFSAYANNDGCVAVADLIDYIKLFPDEGALLVDELEKRPRGAMLSLPQFADWAITSVRSCPSENVSVVVWIYEFDDLLLRRGIRPHHQTLLSIDDGLPPDCSYSGASLSRPMTPKLLPRGPSCGSRMSMIPESDTGGANGIGGDECTAEEAALRLRLAHRVNIYRLLNLQPVDDTFLTPKLLADELPSLPDWVVERLAHALSTPTDMAKGQLYAKELDTAESVHWHLGTSKDKLVFCFRLCDEQEEGRMRKASFVRLLEEVLGVVDYASPSTPAAALLSRSLSQSFNQRPRGEGVLAELVDSAFPEGTETLSAKEFYSWVLRGSSRRGAALIESIYRYIFMDLTHRPADPAVEREVIRQLNYPAYHPARATGPPGTEWCLVDHKWWLSWEAAVASKPQPPPLPPPMASSSDVAGGVEGTPLSSTEGAPIRASPLFKIDDTEWTSPVAAVPKLNNAELLNRHGYLRRNIDWAGQVRGGQHYDVITLGAWRVLALWYGAAPTAQLVRRVVKIDGRRELELHPPLLRFGHGMPKPDAAGEKHPHALALQAANGAGPQDSADITTPTTPGLGSPAAPAADLSQKRDQELFVSCMSTLRDVVRTAALALDMPDPDQVVVWEHVRRGDASTYNRIPLSQHHGPKTLRGLDIVDGTSFLLFDAASLPELAFTSVEGAAVTLKVHQSQRGAVLSVDGREAHITTVCRVLNRYVLKCNGLRVTIPCAPTGAGIYSTSVRFEPGYFESLRANGGALGASTRSGSSGGLRSAPLETPSTAVAAKGGFPTGTPGATPTNHHPETTTPAARSNANGSAHHGPGTGSDVNAGGRQNPLEAACTGSKPAGPVGTGQDDPPRRAFVIDPREAHVQEAVSVGGSSEALDTQGQTVAARPHGLGDLAPDMQVAFLLKLAGVDVTEAPAAMYTPLTTRLEGRWPCGLRVEYTEGPSGFEDADHCDNNGDEGRRNRPVGSGARFIATVLHCDDHAAKVVPANAEHVETIPLHWVTRTLDDNSRDPNTYGRVGLQNLTNTCYMNSTLQVLSHLRPLREYFVSGAYADDLCEAEGELAVSFAELLERLWTTDKPFLAPRKFRALVGKISPDFASNHQQDALDILLALLDTLGRDVRLPSPHGKLLEKVPDTASDMLLARESWKAHANREFSFLSLLFCSQHKATRTCLTCGHRTRHIETTLPPLSLPLPGSDGARIMYVMVALHRHGAQTLNMSVSIPQDAAVEQLLKEVTTVLRAEEAKSNTPGSGTPGSAPDAQRTLVAVELDRSGHCLKLPGWRLKDKVMDKLRQMPKPKRGAQPVVHIYEAEPTRPAAPISVQVVHRRLLEQDELFAAPYRPQLFGTPLLLACTSGSEGAGSGLYEQVWEHVRHVVPGFELEETESAGGEGGSGGDDEGDDSSVVRDSSDARRYPFILTRVSLDGTHCSRCDWNRGCIGCEIEDGSLPHGLANRSTISVDWDLSVIDVYYNECLDKAHDVLPTPAAAEPQTPAAAVESCDLYKCLLSYFETNSGFDAKLSCEGCKVRTPHTQTTRLFTLPAVLVIQLKRFSWTAQQQSRKTLMNVQFPLRGLNLEEFLAREEDVDDPATARANGKRRSVPRDRNQTQWTPPAALSRHHAQYNLHAVVNHVGGDDVNWGHYFTYVRCRCERGGDWRWWELNDSKSSPIAEDRVVSPSAYLLYYIRSDIDRVPYSDLWPVAPDVAEDDGGDLANANGHGGSDSASSPVQANGHAEKDVHVAGPPQRAASTAPHSPAATSASHSGGKRGAKGDRQPSTSAAGGKGAKAGGANGRAANPQCDCVVA